uniref:DNA topoisomerase n=1 Tax=Streptococcus suis TaxID=1307 RepID=A0A2I7ZFE2_STRSU|nr:DNA topoisomerase [Streptococcus suis]
MSRFCKFGKLHVTKGNVDKLLGILLTASKELKRSGPLVGKCPKCGNNIVLKKSFYGCSNYPECKFTLAEHFRKKK